MREWQGMSCENQTKSGHSHLTKHNNKRNQNIMLRKLNKKHAGFRLVEIRTVVAIIALLGAMAVRGFARAKREAARWLNDAASPLTPCSWTQLSALHRVRPTFASALLLSGPNNGRVTCCLPASAYWCDCPQSRDRQYGTTYSSRETIHSSKARCSRSKHSATISFSTPIRVITGQCRIFPTWSITVSGIPTQPVFTLATFSCMSALAYCSTACSHCFFALAGGVGTFAIFTHSIAAHLWPCLSPACGWCTPYIPPPWFTFRYVRIASPFFFLRAHGCSSYAAEALILAG